MALGVSRGSRATSTFLKAERLFPFRGPGAPLQGACSLARRDHFWAVRGPNQAKQAKKKLGSPRPGGRFWAKRLPTKFDSTDGECGPDEPHLRLNVPLGPQTLAF